MQSPSFAHNWVQLIWDHSSEFESRKKLKSLAGIGCSNTSMEVQAMRSLRIFTGGTISRIGVVPELGEDNIRGRKINIVEKVRVSKNLLITKSRYNTPNQSSHT